MFNSLKSKLKSWVSKNKEEVEEQKKTPTKQKSKNPKKKETPKKTKEKTKLDLKKEPQEELPPQKTEETSFFSKFKKKLTEENFEELFEELELILLQNNVAIQAIDSIKDSLKEKLVGKNLSEIKLEEKLKESIKEILIEPPNLKEEIKNTLKEKSPYVILFCGINGSGKTTSLAKLAKYLQKNKFSVCLAAADTFRAASIEQLQQHADSLKVPLIKKDYNADPASVGFDAINYAKKNKIDVVLIDTAGRMQNRDSLMREIEKISKVTRPDLKIFVGESITGNDATEQAKAFNESISIDGIILSKADVDEKGGTALSVSEVTKKPIYFLGTGQNYENLEEFNKDKIIRNLGLS